MRGQKIRFASLPIPDPCVWGRILIGSRSISKTLVNQSIFERKQETLNCASSYDGWKNTHARNARGILEIGDLLILWHREDMSTP